MITKKKVLIITIFGLLFFLFGIYLLNKTYKNNFAKFIKDNTPYQIKNFLKNTIFYIPIALRENEELNIEVTKLNKIKGNLELENIYLKNKLEFGNHEKKIIKTEEAQYELNYFVAPFFDEKLFNNKKSGYVDIYGDNIILVFTSGKIISIKKSDLISNNNFNFKEIKNNLLTLKLFNPEIRWTGIKDLKIFKNTILISVTEEIRDKCYATTLLYSDLESNFLNFQHLFRPNECVEIEKNNINPFKYFNGYQTGGRIIKINDNIFLTTGDYNNWELPQSNKSIFGKIIKINFLTKEFIIVSKGHRNSQGLTILNNDNLIFTDHGPKGGDEINILNLLNKDITNFGWPLASYGEHYDVVPIDNYARKYAPLLKSHKNNNFEEPAFYFKDSVGISEVIQNYYSSNSFFVTSLKNKTIYNFLFNEDTKTFDIKNQIDVGGRIRDIVYDKDLNLYFLYLEDKPSLLVFQKN